MTTIRRSGVSIPRPPEPAAPYRFPVIAALAPVVVAVAIWLVTGSAFALLFAGLGPVTAIASWVDNRFGRRRTGRREARRFAAELRDAREQLSRAQASERHALDEVTPSATAIVHRRGSDPHRWSASAGAELSVTLGRGTVASGITLHSDSHEDRGSTEVRALADAAGALDDAPISVDARRGIGVSGPQRLASAVARTLAVQLAWRLPPDRYWWAGTDEEARWLAELPHRRRSGAVRGSTYEFGRHDGEGTSVVVAVAGAPERLPGACRVVIDVRFSPPRIVSHPDSAAREEIRVDVVSHEECLKWARRLRADATADGIVEPQWVIPNAVELAPLLRVAQEGGRLSLACEPAVSAAGAVSLDLVADGPHAVIGGTTGSGKSELLIAWILAMAAPRSPTDLTFLLVDFKGGSAFDALARLPHTVGIITDLDEVGARRALESLRAELRFRERLLVEQGVRSIDETTACARLVIVVDEFAAMLAEHPELHALFADLAARGRSLGVHLVLCTQRPAGVVRDSVLANVDLRVSLRVNNRADSSAVVGTDAAAAIPIEARGRAIVSRAGANEQLVQFGLANGADIDRVVERWSTAPRPRRPWCEPLPSDLAPTSLPDDLSAGGDGVVFGLCDIPQEQRHAPAVYLPRSDGHLLVMGASGSGKTTALAAISRAGCAVVNTPRGPDAAWDVVSDLAAALENPDGHQRDTLVLIDDLDSLVSRFGPDHRTGFVERLGRVLRDGPARGIRLVLSVQRLTAETQAVAAGVPSRLILRHASRQEFILAGGEGAQYVGDLPPGGAVWRGQRAQIAHAVTEAAPDATAREVQLVPGRPVAIVSSRAAQLLARYPKAVSLTEAVGDPLSLLATAPLLVGDVEEWQSRWGAIATVRATAEVLFDACSTADYRALTRSRHLPPPVSPGVCWRLNDDGTASRARLPE